MHKSYCVAPSTEAPPLLDKETGYSLQNKAQGFLSVTEIRRDLILLSIVAFSLLRIVSLIRHCGT